MAADAVFTGFPASGLAFLTQLGDQNKAWFDTNKKQYQSEVVAPTKAFVEALGDRLTDEFGPGIVALPKTNGSIAPINNDLRFSPDKSPYKDHVMLRFWEGDNKKTAPVLMIRLSEDDVGFATGAPLPDLDRWRALIDDDKTGESLVAAIAKLGKGRDLDVDGQGYKKVPKPFAADHSRADLLMHKGLQVRWLEPTPKSVTTAGFVDHCAKRLIACADVHRWLVDNL